MCQSMVNIQSPTAEIRRGKKEDRRQKSQDENIYGLPITQGDHKRNYRMKILWSALLHRATIITNRKSYMSFRLVPKSVMLNFLERRNGVVLPYFSEFGQLPGALRKSSHCVKVHVRYLMSSCYFQFLHQSFLFRSVRQIKLAIRQLLGARKYPPSYRISHLSKFCYYHIDN